jgi:hypothetical protein
MDNSGSEGSEHSTQNPEVKGSNPATDAGRDKLVEKSENNLKKFVSRFVNTNP